LLLPGSVSAFDFAGEYEGKWSSESGFEDKLQFSPKKTAEGWVCTLSYSRGDDLKGDELHETPKQLSCEVKGDNIAGEYEVVMERHLVRIRVRGTRTDGLIRGTYSLEWGEQEAAGFRYMGGDSEALAEQQLEQT
jgi:hypothetical protein